MEIKTAVIPVAGKGTRFYPVTKAVPKELLPLVDTPVLHHILREAALAGIERVVLVTQKGKTALEDYFDNDLGDELVAKLEVISIRQGPPKGLGHAVLRAKPVVGNEPFAVILGDDVIDAKESVTAQLIRASKAQGNSPVVGVMEVAEADVSKYGIVAGSAVNDRTWQLDHLVEKPKPENAPSRLAIPGRYVLTPDIFDILETAAPSVGGEIQLTDSLQALAKKRKMYAYKFEGERFDAGDKFGYLEASLHYAMKRPELRDRVQGLVTRLAKEIG